MWTTPSPKQALDVMVIGQTKEVAGKRIRINAVRPCLMDIDIHASAGQSDRGTHLAHCVPMQPSGIAEEVALTIVWLMPDAAPYTTGSFLEISGDKLKAPSLCP